MESRSRDFPERGLTTEASVLGFLAFTRTTLVNKVAGLTEEQARQAPIPTSPMITPLGLIKHATAVLRQHIQIHIGARDLPPLWSASDHDSDFRLKRSDSIEAVIAAFDQEWQRSLETLTGIDLAMPVTTYGRANTVGRVLVDVLQELARHLGHLDITRELIDGAKGE
jgi:hypothetical protein